MGERGVQVTGEADALAVAPCRKVTLVALPGRCERAWLPCEGRSCFCHGRRPLQPLHRYSLATTGLDAARQAPAWSSVWIRTFCWRDSDCAGEWSRVVHASANRLAIPAAALVRTEVTRSVDVAAVIASSAIVESMSRARYQEVGSGLSGSRVTDTTITGGDLERTHFAGDSRSRANVCVVVSYARYINVYVSVDHSDQVRGVRFAFTKYYLQYLLR